MKTTAEMTTNENEGTGQSANPFPTNDEGFCTGQHTRKALSASEAVEHRKHYDETISAPAEKGSKISKPASNMILARSLAKRLGY